MLTVRFRSAHPQLQSRHEVVHALLIQLQNCLGRLPSIATPSFSAVVPYPLSPPYQESPRDSVIITHSNPLLPASSTTAIRGPQSCALEMHCWISTPRTASSDILNPTTATTHLEVCCSCHSNAEHIFRTFSPTPGRPSKYGSSIFTFVHHYHYAQPAFIRGILSDCVFGPAHSGTTGHNQRHVTQVNTMKKSIWTVRFRPLVLMSSFIFTAPNMGLLMPSVNYKVTFTPPISMSRTSPMTTISWIFIRFTLPPRPLLLLVLAGAELIPLMWIT
ncbi:unnamed protein product [Allacma fusca]|uniref:Uncharacterized protein n=1 Tax=Allacma fusca TaxID=39272 RepID=A0A8J2NRR8_9HEXA|nr:unnamed protein product [Allacma fusca]